MVLRHRARQLPLAHGRDASLRARIQILFGTDYSPEPIESTLYELPGLSLPKEFEPMMLRGNAVRLFPRFKV